MKILKTLSALFTYLSIQTLSFASNASTALIPVKEGHLYNLPSGDVATHFIPRFIDIFLKISYTVTVVVIIFAGGLYIYAQGDDGDTDKAKNILIYGVVGFLIITVAYAFVQGILNLEWFK